MNTTPRRVLIGCETSGVVRESFRAAGVDAWSMDLLPAEDQSPHHILADHELHLLDVADAGWDLVIVHPPCTYLCSSGLHWCHKRPGRDRLTEKALDFVRALFKLRVPRLCIENPVGRISTAVRKPDQIVQPYQFGDNASKATCLWLRGLPPLRPTQYVPGRVTGYREDGRPIVRWANQTDSGQNRLGPSPDRWRKRSRTYPGIAAAMAAQWGPLLQQASTKGDEK